MPDLVYPGSDQRIEFINNQAKNLWDYFEVTKLMLHRRMSKKDVGVAYACFYRIFQVLPLILSPLDNERILRARTYHPFQPMYSRLEDISYNSTNMQKIKFGRFNLPCEPLFYGSLSTESDEENYLLSCALECCKELTDPNKPIKVQDLAIGGWLVGGELMAINLCYDDLHLADKPKLKRTTERYFEEIKNIFSAEIYRFTREFMSFYAEASRIRSPRKECYLVLCAFFHAARNYYWQVEGKIVHGIIYPGSMSEGKGLNVVLIPDVVDHYLKPDKVLIYRHVLDSQTGTEYIGDKCSDIVDVSNDRFHITNYIPPDGRIK